MLSSPLEVAFIVLGTTRLSEFGSDKQLMKRERRGGGEGSGNEITFSNLAFNHVHEM
jgi:hypothetical protein